MAPVVTAVCCLPRQAAARARRCMSPPRKQESMHSRSGPQIAERRAALCPDKRISRSGIWNPCGSGLRTNVHSNHAAGLRSGRLTFAWLDERLPVTRIADEGELSSRFFVRSFAAVRCIRHGRAFTPALSEPESRQTHSAPGPPAEPRHLRVPRLHDTTDFPLFASIVFQPGSGAGRSRCARPERSTSPCSSRVATFSGATFWTQPRLADVQLEWPLPACAE
jgi:hypothetical protein